MACLQHSVEGYFVPACGADEACGAFAAPIPLEALPPNARLTLARLPRLRFAAFALFLYFCAVMLYERNAELIGSAAGGDARHTFVTIPALSSTLSVPISTRI